MRVVVVKSGGWQTASRLILSGQTSTPCPYTCGPSTLAAMKRIVILISGRGSNMQAIVQRCAEQSWPATVVAVIANRADAAGLGFAAAHGIATAVVDHKAFAAREDFDDALALCVDGFRPDLLVLGGFMRILGAGFAQRYSGRFLNIHPSLLPAFPGLHTHRRALQAGCQAVGATVHFVTAELDHGPIVMQSVVPVMPGDDENSLAARVLATEHIIYPQAVRWFVQDKLRLEDGRVRQIDGASQVLI
jgi:phosphoribosylglycinamide formyltransferase 1